MDIWIILNGEKIGPKHDFEIRRQIENGQLEPTTPGWHEGLDAWKPLVEIEIFSREFELSQPAPVSSLFDESNKPLAAEPTPVTHYIRRFWARWFDLFLYSSLWWFLLWATKQDIEAILRNNWIMFLHYLPWFAIEAFLIQRFSMTPGKWLLGLRVVNDDGSQLDLGESIRRSLRVMLTGVGFGWGILALLCQMLSLFTARRLGKAAWDHIGGHQVAMDSNNPRRIVALVILFYAVIQLQLLVISPYTTKMVIEQFPKLKETYEKMSLWHFPKRS
jgi:uncharacterized RDD family membrane protein YckC